VQGLVSGFQHAQQALPAALMENVVLCTTCATSTTAACRLTLVSKRGDGLHGIGAQDCAAHSRILGVRFNGAAREVKAKDICCRMSRWQTEAWQVGSRLGLAHGFM
jgi:hypothetical protein